MKDALYKVHQILLFNHDDRKRKVISLSSNPGKNRLTYYSLMYVPSSENFCNDGLSFAEAGRRSGYSTRQAAHLAYRNL